MMYKTVGGCEKISWVPTNTPGLFVSWIGKIRIERKNGYVCIGSMKDSLIKFKDEKTLYKFLTV